MLSTSLTNLCFNYYDISGMVKWKQLINGNNDIKSVMNLQICKKKTKTKKNNDSNIRASFESISNLAV